MAEHLFEKRSEILRYLARRSDDAGAPPSVREIGRAVGLKSAQTVHHHLGRLEADGYVERLSDRTSTPVLTEKGWGAVGDDMPLLGRIAAGRGLEAVTMGDEAFSLTSELLFSPSGKRRYTLRVQGNSMTGARIDDGDLLVVEEDEDPPTAPWLWRSWRARRSRSRSSTGRRRRSDSGPRTASTGTWSFPLIGCGSRPGDARGPSSRPMSAGGVIPLLGYGLGDPLRGCLVALSALHPLHPGHHFGVLAQGNVPALGQFAQAAEVAGVGDVRQRVPAQQVPSAF
jgi:repressor LexA